MPDFGCAATSLAHLAARHGGIVDEAAQGLVVRALLPLDRAGHCDVAPFTARRHLALAQRSTAALLVDQSLASLIPKGRRWVHPHASWALAGLLEELEMRGKSELRDPSAQIDPKAELADDVRVGPGAVIMARATVGPASVVEAHAVIYGGVKLGARVRVGAGAVIGRAGFGWALGPSGAMKRIPQLGGVEVHDDVDIGPLCTVDAGTLAPTILRCGVRLDAHVHVGHNAVIGEGTMVAAQSGFAGSVQIGRFVQVGGQAGVADHAQVGDGARIAAKAGVIGNIAAGEVVAGYPAVERTRWLRAVARMLALPPRRP